MVSIAGILNILLARRCINVLLGGIFWRVDDLEGEEGGKDDGWDIYVVFFDLPDYLSAYFTIWWKI